MNPKFSVITPVHIHSEERRDQLFRCIKSLKNQTFQDYEHIIVDDGSVLPWDYPADDKTIVIPTPHLERVNAYKKGFEHAKGEWFALLDSDDEWSPTYLSDFNDMIEKFPDYKMFNCGSKFIHRDGKESFRGPFQPKQEDIGHEEFGGGNIVNGTFIWHRSVREDLGDFPPMFSEDVDCTEINYGGVRRLGMTSPFDFSAYAQLEFPEIRKYFFVNKDAEPNKVIREMGNPWGQDFYLFYKYTRKYHCIPFDNNNYIVHIR